MYVSSEKGKDSFSATHRRIDRHVNSLAQYVGELEGGPHAPRPQARQSAEQATGSERDGDNDRKRLCQVYVRRVRFLRGAFGSVTWRPLGGEMAVRVASEK